MKNKENTTSVVRMIRHVTWVGFWVNALLMVLKVIFGFIGHSDALVADGVHSLSDFATDLIVLVFVGIAYKSADEEHPYGHGKYETFASLLISVILFGVAVGIGVAGIRSIIASLNGIALDRPSFYTIIVALASIGGKEWLYHFTARAGRKVNSSVLVANAWHHRSDAISSVATLIGVSGAFFLGEHWRILDPIASILIALFIAFSAIALARPSIDELLERSLPAELVKRAEDAIISVDGVRDFHHLRTRRNGHSSIIDVHIKVDPLINVEQGHDIATEVENALKRDFGPDIITYVHVEPYFVSD